MNIEAGLDEDKRCNEMLADKVDIKDNVQVYIIEDKN